MSAASRAEILARACAAVAAHLPVEVPRGYRLAGAVDDGADDLVERFCERVADYRAGVRRGSPEQREALVLAAAAAHDARRLGVAAECSAPISGIELQADDPPLSLAALGELDGALTGCVLAIAETGTLVLAGGQAGGRRALTLIPDLHICVVHAAQIVARVPDAITRLEQTGSHRRALTWISGPSATSDIGFERVEGVHGPRRLEVIVLEPASVRDG